MTKRIRCLGTLTCPQCGCAKLYKAGTRCLADGAEVQRWLCRLCGHRFSEHKDDGIIRENKRLSIGAFPKEECIHQAAKKLETATETKPVAGRERQNEAEVTVKLQQFMLYLKKEGLSDWTVATFISAVKTIARHAIIDDPESVKTAISKMPVSGNTKFLRCCAYERYLASTGKTWVPPNYGYVQKLPEFLPTTAELDQLASGLGRKISALVQLIRETGMRLGEALSLTWDSVNSEKRIITLTKAEKNSKPRVFVNLSTILITMLSGLPKQNQKVFGRTTENSAITGFCQQRKRLAQKLGNPRMAKIHFHLIRHWYATTQYHKKPDMYYVANLLGHKHTTTTEIYINMEKMMFGEGSGNDDYLVKVAKTLDEACKLLEVGFEFVTDMDGAKLFRKRK